MTEETGKKLLVAEDDEMFLIAMKESLQKQGYDVTGAANGKIAQNLIALQDFDAVISDIRLPEMNGIELLHFIKRTKPLPVILMTGFAELTETKEAHELGAEKFIAKPFKLNELLSALSDIFKLAETVKIDVKKESQKDVDGDFCKISIDDFVSGKEIQYDIFIRLSANKYVKVAHSGENIPVERIRTYKSKNLRYLYLKKEDYDKYLGFNLNLARAIKSSTKVSKPKKLNFLRHAGEVILEHVYVNEVSAETFEYAKTSVETTLSVVSEDKDYFDLLDILNNHSDFLYAHSLGVCVYSIAIAADLKWTSPGNKFKISMGGLFHDIGKKEIDRAIIDKPRKDLTPEEVKMIETHPMRGMEVLNHVQGLPGDILLIVQQHHENCAGLGYPLGLKKERIHPLARLVSVANEFCNLVIKNPNSPGMNAEEAIKRLFTLYSGVLDAQMLFALSKVFKVAPPAL